MCQVERAVGGFVRQFHDVLAVVRACFKYGTGRVVARSIAKRLKLPWRSPTAPHSAGTRMIAYESSRCPANLLVNLRCAVLSLRFREKEAVESARRAYARQRGEASVIGPKAGWTRESRGQMVLCTRELVRGCRGADAVADSPTCIARGRFATHTAHSPPRQIGHTGVAVLPAQGGIPPSTAGEVPGCVSNIKVCGLKGLGDRARRFFDIEFGRQRAWGRVGGKTGSRLQVPTCEGIGQPWGEVEGELWGLGGQGLSGSVEEVGGLGARDFFLRVGDSESSGCSSILALAGRSVARACRAPLGAPRSRSERVHAGGVYKRCNQGAARTERPHSKRRQRVQQQGWSSTGSGNGGRSSIASLPRSSFPPPFIAVCP